jgi:hypothetical protein
MGMTPAIDVLLDARALLAKPNGWIQGQRRMLQPDGSRAYCIEGAIEAAAPDSGVTPKAWARVQSVLHQLIPEYNDAPGRQQSEVVETIDRAIQAEWRGDPLPAPLSCSFLYQHQDSEIWTVLENMPPPTPNG